MATGGARGVRSGQDRGAAGKVAEEAVIRVLVILLDILIVVLLEKTTHEPELRSTAVTDGQERAGSKGPKPNRQMGDNLRKTIVERRVDAEIKECPKCKGRFPDNIPCSTASASRPSSSTCWSPKCCPCAVALVQAISGIKLSEATCLDHSPPRPMARASVAAHRRRARSFRTGRNTTNLDRSVSTIASMTSSMADPHQKITYFGERPKHVCGRADSGLGQWFDHGLPAAASAAAPAEAEVGHGFGLAGPSLWRCSPPGPG